MVKDETENKRGKGYFLQLFYIDLIVNKIESVHRIYKYNCQHDGELFKMCAHPPAH